jgi:ABC-type Fe3+ transport system permease subunit
MLGWRLAVAVVVIALIGGPLVLPFVDLAGEPAAWAALKDWPRLVELARTTAQLVAAVLAVDLPLGTILAVLLYRSDLPGRIGLRRVIIVSLFVPLPLLTSAWQAALGSSGWLGSMNTGFPWATGLRAAIWVHAAAGLPWVVWVVGQGLCWVEPEVEDDARLAAGPWQVLWWVTLPRAGGAVLAAAAWVALLTAHEITVTDMTQVRTFAEEVYTQFVLPTPGGGLAPDVSIARAVAVAMPGTILVATLLAVAAWRWECRVPPLGTAPEPQPLVDLGAARWPVFAATCVVIGLLLAVPIGSLGWKLGLHGYPETWSATTAEHYLRLAARAHRGLIAGSLVVAAAAGVITAGLALLVCWLARDSRALRVLAVAVVALAWATPGPVVGAGLKSAIERLVELEDRLTGPGPVRQFLYDGPSPGPVVWVGIVRFFPCAVALLWPAVRLVPSSLSDSARADGARPATELRHAVWPLTASASARAAVAVGVLSLGELSAGKLVATPGDRGFGETFAHVVWTRMHYGVANHLAALCLLLLAVAVVPTAAFLFISRARRPIA